MSEANSIKQRMEKNGNKTQRTGKKTEHNLTIEKKKDQKNEQNETKEDGRKQASTEYRAEQNS